jgi:hypothetical protein
MNKKEFNQAVNLAKTEIGFDDTGLFYGFALRDFKPVVCTIKAIAGLIKYQALQFNGEFDHAALNEIWECKRRFIVADSI